MSNEVENNEDGGEDVVGVKTESSEQPSEQSQQSRPLGAFAMLYGNQENQGGSTRRAFRPMMKRRMRRSAPTTEPAKTEEQSTTQPQGEENPTQQPNIMGGDDDESSDDDDSTEESSSEEEEEGDSDEDDGSMIEPVEKTGSEEKVETQQPQTQEQPRGAFSMLENKSMKPFRRMLLPRRRSSQPSPEKEEVKEGEEKQESTTDSQPKSRPLGAFAMLYGGEDKKPAQPEGSKPLKPFRPLMQRRTFKRNTTSLTSAITTTTTENEEEEKTTPPEEEKEPELQLPQDDDDDAISDSSSESSYGMTSDEEEEMEEQKQMQKDIIMSNPISVLVQPSKQLVDHIEEMDSLRKSKQEFSTKYKNMKKVVADMQQMNDRLLESRNYSFDIQTNLNQSNDTIRSLGIRNRNNKVALEKTRKENDRITMENKTLTEEVERLKNEVSELTKKIPKEPYLSKEEEEALRKDVSELQEKLKTEEALRKVVEEKNFAMEKKLESDVQEIDKLVNRIKELNSQKKKNIGHEKAKAKAKTKAEVTEPSVTSNKKLQPQKEEEEEEEPKEDNKKNKITFKQKMKKRAKIVLQPFENTKQHETLEKVKRKVSQLKTKELREVSAYVRPTEVVSRIGMRLLIVFGIPPVEAEKWVVCRRFIQMKMKGEIAKRESKDYADVKGLISIRRLRKEVDRETSYRHSKVIGIIYDFLGAVERVATEFKRRNRIMGKSRKKSLKTIKRPSTTLGLISGRRRASSAIGIVKKVHRRRDQKKKKKTFRF